MEHAGNVAVRTNTDINAADDEIMCLGIAYMAMERLQKHGYKAIPVNPAFAEVPGEQCYPSIRDVPGPIDTVTMYLAAERSTPLIDDIIQAKPRRIIFNPGAENDALVNAAKGAGIEVIIGCTLVMLDAGGF